MIIPPPHEWDGTTAQRLLPTFKAHLQDARAERQRREGIADESSYDLDITESRCRDAIEMLEKIVAASFNWLLASRIVTALRELFEAPPRRALTEGLDSEL